MLLCSIFGCPASGAPNEKVTVVPLAEPVHQQGTISFVMRLDQSLQNGRRVQPRELDVLTLEGLARVYIEHDPAAITPWLKWEQTKEFVHSYVRLTEMPGPEEYFVQFTWNAEQGLMDTCYNGYPTRELGSRLEPWRFGGELARTARIAPAAGVSVTDLKVSPRYTPPAPTDSCIAGPMCSCHRRAHSASP